MLKKSDHNRVYADLVLSDLLLFNETLLAERVFFSPFFARLYKLV